MYMKNFNGVFAAIDQGLCQYGVLPLENSTAGSVNQIYDLMMKYNFYVVKSVKLKIDHSLLAKEGNQKKKISKRLSLTSRQSCSATIISRHFQMPR